MKKKTNKDLVAYAHKALAEKWGYVWGTFGHMLTEQLLKQKKAQYPEGVGSCESFIRANWMGRKVTDCVGLIKSCLWWDGTVVRYDPASDITADSMYAKASAKGPIAGIPDVPGLCVWKKGHIGVYVGQINGRPMVIEAYNTRRGVVMTPLKGAGSTPWTHWLECPFIDYIKEEDDVEKIKVLVNGKAVEGFLKDGVSFVPARAVSESLGAQVDWDGATKTVTIKGRA